ncbi:tripartite tricarboxylate transporter substrate binding protein [Achromobacter sp. GG226]|nr:tripartite tricarboxylate transporter substrate binding protein [Verticiella sp. GG226]
MNPLLIPRSAASFLAAALMLAAPLGNAVHAADTWPDGRMITWVVPFPPGGTTDVLGRTIAQRLGQSLNTQVIVENKAGATGTIGAAQVARAAPDGYTLLGTSIGPQTIAPHLMKLSYDPIGGFAPVVTIGTIPHLLVVGKNQPFQNVPHLLEAAKSKPGTVAFASGGLGTVLQMQAELLGQQTGARFLHVPYKGDTPALQDTLGGQVQFMFAPVTAALPHVTAGNLRALATTSAQRLSALPDIPTMTELGMKDFVVEQWQGVFAPAGTPPAIVARLNRDIAAALKTPEITELAGKLGVTLVGAAPEELGARQKADSDKWAKVIRDGDIKAE